MSEEEVSEQAKKEAEEFVDSLLRAVAASGEYIKTVSTRLDIIDRRLMNIELALTDDKEMGKA